jgi:hypothetical protein
LIPIPSLALSLSLTRALQLCGYANTQICFAGQYTSARGYHYAPGTTQVLSQKVEAVNIHALVEVTPGADIMEI